MSSVMSPKGGKDCRTACATVSCNSPSVHRSGRVTTGINFADVLGIFHQAVVGMGVNSRASGAKASRK